MTTTGATDQAGSLTATIQTSNAYRIISTAVNIAIEKTPPAPPGIPTLSPVTVAGPTSLNVSWNTPDTNGSPITGYGIQFKPEDDSIWTYWNNKTNKGTSDTITTLKLDTTYQVQVRAHSAAGESSWSSEQTATTESFNASLSHLFPTGTPTKMNFDAPLAGDPGGGGASHVFHVRPSRPGRKPHTRRGAHKRHRSRRPTRLYDPIRRRNHARSVPHPLRQRRQLGHHQRNPDRLEHHRAIDRPQFHTEPHVRRLCTVRDARNLRIPKPMDRR